MTQAAILEQKPGKPTRRYMPFIQLLIVLAFLGAMYYSFVGNVLSKATPVPMRVGTLTRYQFETDKDAIPQIRRLYGTNMPIDSAYVAHYEGSGTTLNIWVAEADEGDVRKLLGDLTQKIEAGEHPIYSELKKQDVGGMIVYSVKKDGEPQYYYQTGKKFVWIGILGGNSGSTAQIMKDAMRTITGSHEGM